MTLSIVMLVVVPGALLVAVRRLVPDRACLFQGMFRYEIDLGWPHGVQEEDGERAWVAHEALTSDPETDELAWDETIGMSTIVELEAGSQPTAVPMVRVVGEVSRVRSRGDP